MKRVLVDANALLDVLTDDPQCYEWSAARMDACSASAARLDGGKISLRPPSTPATPASRPAR